MSEPIFCDLCTSATGVVWTWFTPNAAPSLEEAKAQNVPWFEDEEWAICDTCHRLILAGKRESVFDRAMTANSGVILLQLDKDSVAHKLDPEPMVRQVHGDFWRYKNDRYERVP